MPKIKLKNYCLHHSFIFYVLINIVKTLNLSVNIQYNNLLINTIQVLMRNFPPGFLVHIMLDEDNIPYIPALVEEEWFDQWELVISQPDTLPEDLGVLVRSVDAYIIFINYKEHYYHDYLNNMITVQLNQFITSWSPDAKFLLVISSGSLLSKKKRFSIVKETFNFMWRRNVFRIAIVIVEKNGEGVTVFSSAPFSEYFKTCKEISNKDQIQEIILNNTNLSETAIVGYFHQTPTNFLNCPMVAFTFHFPPYTIANNNRTFNLNTTYDAGTEIELVNLFSKIYNISLNIYTPHYGIHTSWVYNYPNGTSTGMLRDVLNFKIDLAFAGSVPHPDYFVVAQVITFVFNSMSWYVPSPEIVPQWKLLTNIFTLDGWIALAVTFVLFTSLYYLTEYIITKVDKRGKNAEPAYLIMTRLLLGNSVFSSPRLNHQRIILTVWYLFSLHITIMCNTKLFSLLTSRAYSPELQTVEELYNSGLKTCTPKRYIDFYINRTDSFVQKVLQNSEVCNDLEEVAEEFFTKKDFSIMGKDDHMAFLLKLSGRKIHKLKESFYTYPVSILVTKGSVIQKLLEKIVLNISESGVMTKWRHDLHNDANIKFHRIRNQAFVHFALDNKDLVWVYILLLIGHFSALTVFLLELWFGNRVKQILKLNNVRKY